MRSYVSIGSDIVEKITRNTDVRHTATEKHEEFTGEYKKTRHSLEHRVSRIKNLAVTYFHMGTPILSSARSVFTTEFGMGSGGSHLLLPPGNWLLLTWICRGKCCGDLKKSFKVVWKASRSISTS